MLKCLPQEVTVTLKGEAAWTFLFNAAYPKTFFGSFIVVVVTTFVSFF